MDKNKNVKIHNSKYNCRCIDIVYRHNSYKLNTNDLKTKFTY